jgi:hypothetical protein
MRRAAATPACRGEEVGSRGQPVNAKGRQLQAKLPALVVSMARQSWPLPSPHHEPNFLPVQHRHPI